MRAWGENLGLLCWRVGVTYFPPQKILVVMTRLDRLQGERENHWWWHLQSPMHPAWDGTLLSKPSFPHEDYSDGFAN